MSIASGIAAAVGDEVSPLAALERSSYRGYYEVYGYAVTAKASSGEDMFLWTSPYHHRGEPYLQDADVQQTLLIVGDRAAEMHDNDFIESGQYPHEWFEPGSLVTSVGHEDVARSLGGRRYTGRPPEWRVEGEHGGVDLDLTMTAGGHPFWHFGPFRAYAVPGGAGYLQHGPVSGRISTGGRDYDVDGFGAHTHMVWTSGTDPEPVDHQAGVGGGRGMYWHHGYGPGFSWFINPTDRQDGFSASGRPTLDTSSADAGIAYVLVGGRVVETRDPRQLGIENTEYWLDPMSGMRIPVRWHVWVQTDEIQLHGIMRASARANYLWPSKLGTAICTWYLVETDVTVTLADGTRLSANGAPSIMQTMRQFHVCRQPVVG